MKLNQQKYSKEHVFLALLMRSSRGILSLLFRTCLSAPTSELVCSLTLAQLVQSMHKPQWLLY